MRQIAFGLVFLVLASGCLGGPRGPAQSPGPGTAEPVPVAGLQKIADGLDRPLYVTHAGDGSGRLFIVEQPGTVRVWRNGTLLATPFVDLSALVESGGYEQGLLSIAFHPQFEANGVVIVDYTSRASDGDTVLARYRVQAGNPDRLDPNSGETLLTQNQPYSNHNGGLVLYGPDGYLYVGLGDGGSGGDPHGNGQDLDTLLGKILRIDVGASGTYLIPPTNPFQGGSGKGEIWAYGVRNPWRFSFDRQTRDLYMADVGQNNWEEVNFQPAASDGGENYGWNIYEGNHRFRSGEAPGVVFPMAEYANAASHCSVTGGYVYRGSTLAALQGAYLFGDFCSGTLWTLRHLESGWVLDEWFDTDLQVSSFGEDEAGELYVADLGGAVYRFVPA